MFIDTLKTGDDSLLISSYLGGTTDNIIPLRAEFSSAGTFMITGLTYASDLPVINAYQALRLFAHRAVVEQRPYIRFFEDGSERFLQTFQVSEALKARARAVRDELTDTITNAFLKAASQLKPDSTASLAASLLVTTWEAAFLEAHRIFHHTRSVSKANKALLATIDQGTRGTKAAAQGSPYT